MMKKNILIGLICIAAVFMLIGIYKGSSKTFKIVNKTEKEINNIRVVEEDNEDTNSISISEFSTEVIKLPKSNKNINIIYFYNDNQSSESFEIRNNELKIKYSEMIIDSVDNNMKINVELN